MTIKVSGFTVSQPGYAALVTCVVGVAGLYPWFSSAGESHSFRYLVYSTGGAIAVPSNRKGCHYLHHIFT